MVPPAADRCRASARGRASILSHAESPRARNAPSCSKTRRWSAARKASARKLARAHRRRTEGQGAATCCAPARSTRRGRRRAHPRAASGRSRRNLGAGETRLLAAAAQPPSRRARAQVGRRDRAARSCSSAKACAQLAERADGAARGQDQQPNPPASSPPRRREDDDESKPRCGRKRSSEFIGQQQARANLSVFIEAARARNEALDHVLFVGPARASARPRWRRSSRANSASTSAPPPGPVIAKAGDLAALLTNLEARDVLFIDEIHRLNPAVEEILYPAMEDFQLDLIIGEGPAARSVKIDLAPFTLVGATTRAGPAHQAAARPLRHSGAAQFLHRGRTGADRQPRRARARHRHDAGRRERDRAPRARHAAHRRTAAAARARLRRRRPDATAIDRAVADEALMRARSRRRRPRRHGPALSHD